MTQEYISQFKIEDFNQTDILIFSGIDKGFPNGYITTALKYDADAGETVFEYASDATSDEIQKSAHQILQELEQAERQTHNYSHLNNSSTREIEAYINELNEVATMPLEQVRNGACPSEISETPNFSIQVSTKEEMTATPVSRQSMIQEFNRL